MSRTTESLHIRAFSDRRLVPLVDAFMRERGLTRTDDPKHEDVRVIALRRDGRWTTLADSNGFGRAAPSELDDWGAYVSRVTGRSVLTMLTWDGEASVEASRWKRGKRRARLTLLEEAFRSKDRTPRAPAKVLWPWLAPEKREAILRDGIPLIADSPSATGDAELDQLLDGFDEEVKAKIDDSGDDEHIFIEEHVSVSAIGRAVGIKTGYVDPWSPSHGDRTLRYTPAITPASRRGRPSA